VCPPVCRGGALAPPPRRAQPLLRDRTVWPYRAPCELRCDKCAAAVTKGALCRATCLETESGGLLTPHEITCADCAEQLEAESPEEVI
jgi:hypothetical protein